MVILFISAWLIFLTYRFLNLNKNYKETKDLLNETIVKFNISAKTIKQMQQSIGGMRKDLTDIKPIIDLIRRRNNVKTNRTENK